MNPDKYVRDVIENVEYAGDELWQDELRMAVTMLNERGKRIAELEAKLAPWREMERMIKENVAQFEFRISEGFLNREKSWVDLVEYDTQDVWSGEGDTLPEAVKAAYGEVSGE